MQRKRWMAFVGVAVLLLPATLAASQVPQLPGLVPPLPASWAPTEEPAAYQWKTWVLAGANQLRPPFPPELTTLEGAEELVALKRAQLQRTAEQVETAKFWDTGPAGQRWTELMLNMISAHGPSPPRVARGLALLHIAVYDALVAAWDAKHFYNRSPPSVLDPTLLPAFPPRNTASYPSEHAAVAGAASRILEYMYPQQGIEFFEDKAVEAALSRVWAGVNWPSDVVAGLELGHEVADKVLRRATQDSSDLPWDGKRVTGDCTWNPTPPGFVFPPLEPMWGKVRPWLMTRGDQFRPGPPPACGGAEFLEQTMDVYEKSKMLTDEEQEIAFYWADGPNTVTPPGHWNLIALDLLSKYPQSTPRAARTFAYLGAVLQDAGVAVWDAKYTYWWERPIETIREGIDPQWNTLITTPPFPGYVSGHSGFSGAGAKWLGHAFPEEKVALRAMASEAAQSRFLAGIHIQADNAVGLDMGKAIADLAIGRAMADGA